MVGEDVAGATLADDDAVLSKPLRGAAILMHPLGHVLTGEKHHRVRRRFARFAWIDVARLRPVLSGARLIKTKRRDKHARKEAEHLFFADRDGVAQVHGPTSLAHVVSI